LGCTAIVPLSTSASGQEDDSRRLAEKVEQFFESLASDNQPDAVFNDLLTGSQLASERSEQLQKLLEEYGKLEVRYGKFLEASELDVRKVGDSLIFLTYLYKSERFPVVWRFVYYRPPSDQPEGPDWFVVRLSFDTRIDDLPQLSRGL